MASTFFGRNLEFLRIERGLNQQEIAELVGKKQNTISNWEAGRNDPDFDDLNKIIKFFDISVSEFLYSDLTQGNLNNKSGDQKKGQKGNAKGNLKGNLSQAVDRHSRMPKVVTVDSSGVDNVVLVPVRARAGYLAGHEDPEFIQTLPSYRLPGLTHGTFRMFEVQGHSMVPTFDESDIVICRFAENFAEIRDDRIHVVVTKLDGLVVKRVVNRVSREGKLILNSDNQRHRGEYPPIIVDAEDVLELWYAVAYISRQMRSPGEIYNRLIEVESRLTLLESDHKKLLKK